MIPGLKQPVDKAGWWPGGRGKRNTVAYYLTIHCQKNVGMMVEFWQDGSWDTDVDLWRASWGWKDEGHTRVGGGHC